MSDPRTVVRRPWAAGVVVLGAALGLAACRGGHPQTTPRSGPPAASPTVRNAQRGLELMWWTVSDPRPQLPTPSSAQVQPHPAPPPAFTIHDDKTDIESLLAPYLGRPVPLPTDLRERWRQSGLRIIAVPVADLDRILDGARLTGQVQRQWLGEVSSWTDTIRPSQIREPTGVTLAGGILVLQPGRLRLTIRAWLAPRTTPESGATAALHIELVPRLDPYIPERERFRAAAEGTAPEVAPQIFASLATTIEADGADALVLLADDPGADWSYPPTPRQGDGQKTGAGGSGYGPDAAPATSLGEFLLSIPGTPRSARVRHVMTVIPHVPGRFELLAR